jgi:hypothetical protein
MTLLPSMKMRLAAPSQLIDVDAPARTARHPHEHGQR